MSMQRLGSYASLNQHRQRGLTLVELMIALVLGLIIISAVINVYVGSTRSARFSEGLRSMQENGRFGVSALQRGIRMAGFSPDVQIAPFDFTTVPANGFAVRMRMPTDCNGGDAPADGIVVNTYSLNDQRQIICRGNSAQATNMPLVEDVWGFRVLYGIDEDGDAFSERYVPYSAALNPLEVNSVRFALLVGSGGPIRSRATEQTHMLLDQPVQTDDRRSRRVFTTTVLLRNRR